MKRSKYEPGRIHIILFDVLGVKQRTIIPDSDNFVKAIEQGKQIVKDDELITSFSILRVINNSLIRANEISRSNHETTET